MQFNRKSLAVTTAIAAMLLAGCASPSPQPEQTQPAQEQTASPDQVEQSPDSNDESQPESGVVSSASEEDGAEDDNGNPGADGDNSEAAQGKVFTSKTITAEGAELKLDLYEIEDDGALATVKMDLTNEGSDGDSFQISDFFGDGNGVPPGKGSEPDPKWSHSMRGVTLTDTKNKKLHRVAYDSLGQCLCDMDLSGRFVKEGDTIQLTASFAPIPDGQDTTTVTIPNFGTFKNVPINR